MEKVFIIDSYCYLRQYAYLDRKVAEIKKLKVNKVFEKQIQITVEFTLGIDANATGCCFYLSRGTAPSPSPKWKDFGDITLPNGQEATLFVQLSEY